MWDSRTPVFFIYIYLLICLDASGLGCGTRDLLLQCENSVVVAYRFSCSAACGILVSRPGIEHGSPELQGGKLMVIKGGRQGEIN